MELQEITEKIIACAFKVHNRMGFGYIEDVYERCMMIELPKTDLEVFRQVEIPVHYEGQLVGKFVADLLVEGVVIVELKSVRALAEIHEVQLVNYLVATGKPVGLLLNFGPTGVQIKRKLRELPAAVRQSG